MSYKKKSKRSLIKAVSVSVLGAGSSAVMAAPTGGIAVSGGITIGSMNNSEMVITQALQKGIINWTDFSIDAGELVRFAQQAGNDSITLNRVLGSQVSSIQGALQANGNIFLINPNGIVFGAGSQVDVAGLLATTFDVTDDSFLNGGQLNFTQVAGKDLAAISNQGTITTGTGGFVYLVAPKVDNSGYVIANVGTVKMAAGDRFTVNLQGSNLINFNVSADTLSAATGSDLTGVSNSGTVSAQTVLLEGNSASALMSSVVNNSGVIEATELTINAGDIVQNGTIQGVGTAAATSVSLNAAQSITTGSNSSTRAQTLNLSVTDEGASIGAEGVALKVNADVLNASTHSGHILVTDVSGGVALGNLTAGTPGAAGSVVIKAEQGSIVANDPSATQVTGYSANFIADQSVGSAQAAINTQVSVLSASTQDGEIHVYNDGSLIVGDVIAREAITVGGQVINSSALDNSGDIALSNGAAGTKNVSITAKDSIALTGTLSATNQLSVSSTEGSILAAQNATQLVGREVDLFAGQSIGDSSRGLNTQSNSLTAHAADGGIYLTESNGLNATSLLAEGSDNDIKVATLQGNITLGTVTAAGGTVSVDATNGGVSGATGGLITAAELDVTSKNNIGASNKALATHVDRISAETTGVQASVTIANSKALESIAATTPNGDVKVTYTGGELNYKRSTSELSLTSATDLDVEFNNTAGSLKMSGMDVGAKDLSLSASGTITQSAGTLKANKVTLNASGNIGDASNALETEANELALTTRSGQIHVENTSTQVEVTARSQANSGGAIRIGQSGDLVVKGINTKGAVTLDAGGTVTQAASVQDTAITAGSLDVSGQSIGTDSQSLTSLVNGTLTLDAQGDVYAANSGAVTLLNIMAAAGRVAFKNTGDVTVDLVQGAGEIQFDVTGDVLDGNGASANFAAQGLTAAIKSFGSSTDALEIEVAELVIDAANGGIYAKQIGGNLISLEQLSSGGVGSHIDFAADGSILLGHVDAGGNNVSISSGGSIEDGRTDLTKANVVARGLTMSAPGGIGVGGKLDLDVSFLSASGGAGGVSASNANAVAIDSATLTGKGASAITIVATAITVLDNSGQTITMDGGTLTLTATAGNIVFLNQSDTIYLPGGGSITLSAMNKSSDAVPGYDGVIIAGNLVTEGGDITLNAQSNITIGLLDAGSQGNVTVSSTRGIILDGNGAAQNIVGKNVSLSASTPSAHDAELNRDTAIAEYSARDAEAAAKRLQLDILIQQLRDYEALVHSAQLQLQLAALSERLADIAAEEQGEIVGALENRVNELSLTLNAATLARNAIAVVAGAAQAVPFSGDAGADAAFAVVDLAMSIAALALDQVERYDLAPAADELVDLKDSLDVAKAALKTATTNLFTVSVIRNTTATSKASADLSVFKADTARDAAMQVRQQAVAAYDQNQQFSGTSTNPLGITAERLDLNGGGALDADLHLNSAGNLGLGNINVGDKEIIANAGGDISIVGHVQAGLIDLESQQAIRGLANSLLQAERLVMAAQHGIDVITNTKVVAADAGLGSLSIDNLGTETLTVGQIDAVVGISAGQAVTISTDGDLAVDKAISSASSVTLTSEGSVTDGNADEVNVSGTALTVAAGGDVDLDTAVSSYQVETQGGNVNLREADDVLVSSVTTGNGSVDIAAQSMTVNTINAGTGNVTLNASQGAVSTTGTNHVSAAGLTVTSAAGVAATGVLNTSVDTLNIDAQGAINVTEADAVTATSVHSTQGDIKVTAGGDLVLGDVGTDATNGTVTLVSDGQISNGHADDALNVHADNLVLTAAHGIGDAKAIRTDVDVLDAYSANGSIKVDNLGGDLTVQSLQNKPTYYLTQNGDVAITTNGSMTVTQDLIVNNGGIRLDAKEGDLTLNDYVQTSDGDINLAAQGNLTLNGSVYASNGNIDLAALGGDLTQADWHSIGTDNGDVTGTASGNINLRNYTYASHGDITYTAGTGVTLNYLDASAGDITVTAADGDITVNSSVNSYDGDIDLTAQNGNLTLNGSVYTSNGNIDLSALGGDLTQTGWNNIQAYHGDVTGTASGNVNLNNTYATNGDITYTAGTGVELNSLYAYEGDITVTAADGDITVNSSVNSYDGNIDLAAQNGNLTLNSSVYASNGNIDLAALGGDLTQYSSVVTDSGNITANAAGQIAAYSTVSSGNGDITYTAGTSATFADVATGAGNIALTTNGGDLTTNGAVESGEGNIALTAAGNLTQHALVDTASGNITGTATGSIETLATTSTGNGDITYTAGTSATFADVATGAGNIALTTNGGDLTTNGVVESGEGNIALTAAGNLTQHALVDTASGNITGTATGSIETLATTSTGNGDITYTAGTSATFADVATGAGNIALTTNGGDLTTNGAVESGAGNIELTAQNGDLTQQAVVQTAAGDIALKALQGAISSNAQVATSQGNINANARDALTVTELNAQQGNVSLSVSQGAIEGQGNALNHIQTSTLTLNAGTDVGANESLRTQVDTLIANVGGSISLTEADALTVAQLNAQNVVELNAGDLSISALNAADVVITSTGTVATTATGQVNAQTLSVEAQSGIDLNTDVDSATLAVMGTGDIRINEAGALVLTNVTTANGDIQVNAVGDMGVRHVAANGDVDLQSSQGAITTDRPNFLMRMLARVAPAFGISGNNVNLDAANGIGNGAQGTLNVAADSITANTQSGDINLHSTQSTTLNQISTAAGDINLSVDGDAVAGQISATGAVNLSSTGQVDGASNGLIQGNSLSIEANGVGQNSQLTTSVDHLNVDSGVGGVNIQELNGLLSVNVNSQDGDVQLSTLAGNMGLGSINAQDHQVILNSAGSILNNGAGANNIDAAAMQLNAQGDVGQVGNGLNVNVQDLSAGSNLGSINLNSTTNNPLNVHGLNTNQGDINLQTPGQLNLAGNVTSTGGDINLGSGSNINQGGLIQTTGNGDITLSAADNIAMGAGSQTIANNGTVTYDAGNSVAVESIQTSTNIGGGSVVFTAPSIIANMPGVSSVQAWEVVLPSGTNHEAVVRDLMGNANNVPRVVVDGRVIGGSIAESRRFMEALLQPALATRTGTEQLLTGGVLNQQQISPRNGFVDGENGVRHFKP